MRENGLKKLWAEGKTAVNGWLAIPSSYSAEAMAHEDFDSVTVDMQHGMIDFQAAVTMLQAISTTSKTPMVRVPWNDPALIMKALDAGSYGVICPMISNREQCERFVGACRYPPRGYRSFGPPRGLLYGGADYPTKSGDTILAVGMIETKEAMDQLDAIWAELAELGAQIATIPLDEIDDRLDDLEGQILQIIEADQPGTLPSAPSSSASASPSGSATDSPSSGSSPSGDSDPGASPTSEPSPSSSTSPAETASPSEPAPTPTSSPTG